ncbi:MAG: hypothetical protein GY950_07950 [bacterium]|nr:hypothetical protein [bacterium]
MRILLFCFIFAALIAFAQDMQGQKKKDTGQAVAAAAEKLDPEAMADGELGTGEFVYRPRGRRDPFWDLLRGKNAKLKKEAKEGIAGLEIEQLELEGIIGDKGKYIALFKGPDSKPYDVRVGQSVYDGEIIKIDANSVVFKKILTIALGGTKEKTVIKWLNPEKENEK